MIQVIILDTDNKMIVFSRSDEKEYTQAKYILANYIKLKLIEIWNIKLYLLKS